MLTSKQLLKGKLVVSCQAAPNDPLENVDTIRRIARAVVAAGASGLRINSPEHIAAIRQDTDVPIIGIQKRHWDGQLYITPDFASAAALAKAGASIIALDCTNRPQSQGEPWQQLIGRIHLELQLPVMADISSLDEALAAASHGADFLGTTLYGYTPQTAGSRTFSWTLLEDIVRHSDVPVIAEGRVSTPRDARRAIDLGAWCVVVGSAITRPGNITTDYLRAIHPQTADGPVIGVDIGGTVTKAALVDASGQIMNPVQVPTHASGGRDAIVSALLQAVDLVMASAHSSSIVPSGLGIASAGVIDSSSGSVFAATDNLPQWAGFPLRSFAEERFNLPSRVVNDAQAAALAELLYGKGKGRQNFVAVTIGTGIGGGIIFEGKLVRGQRGFGGTIGHHVIRTGGRPCNCGRNGCLEAYVSTAALIEEYKALGGFVPPLPSENYAALVLRISQMAQQRDPIAQRAYEVLIGYLAEGIANIFNILDPEAVILSGGMLSGCPDILSALREQVTGLLHFGSIRMPLIELSDAGQYAGVQGAAALFLEL